MHTLVKDRTLAFRRGLGATIATALTAAALAIVPTAASAADAPAGPHTLTNGTISWGVKASWRDYLAMPFVDSTTTAIAPATDDAAITTFANASGVWKNGDFSISAVGGVNFTGHGGILNLTISDPTLKRTGDSTQLLVDVVDSDGFTHDDLAIADVDLDAATITKSGDTINIADAPTTLTEDGTVAFNNGGAPMYAAGSPLSPLNATLNVIDGNPQVTLSQSELLLGETATITVSGSGFDPATVSGTRPPLANKPAGTYVVLGYFAENWRPSAGAPSANRKIVPGAENQKWAVLADNLATIGGAAAGGIELNPDGTFETSFEVSKSQLDAIAAANPTLDGKFGIYTYPGSGGINADYETFTPITFTQPSVEVSKTEFFNDETATITVDGKGFDPSIVTSAGAPIPGKPAGVFVTFSKFSENWKPSNNAPSANRVRNNASLKWALMAEDIATVGGAAAGGIELKTDGTFSAELTIDKAALDALAVNPAAELPMQYGIYTYAGGVNTKNADYETFTPITFVKHDSAISLSNAVAFAGVAKTLSVSVAPNVTGDVTLTGLPGGDLTATITAGKATFTAPSTLALGSYPLTASYAGDANVNAGESAATLTVAAAPTVQLSRTQVFSDETATITVTGAGFNPNAVSGSRPPLANKAAGTYVVLGYFAENWRPSAGAPSANRKIVSGTQNQQWAVLADNLATIGGASAGGIELKPDGTFETSFVVSKSQLETIAAANPTLDGKFGIYTYPGSGGVEAGYETFTPITFADRVASPEITIAPVASTTLGAGGTLTVNAPVAGTMTVAGLGSQTVTAAGPVTFTLPANLPLGVTSFAVSFAPSDPKYLAPGATTVTVTVGKATVSTKLKVTKKPTTKKAGKAKLTVKGPAGVAAPTGKAIVTLKKGKKVKKVKVTVKNGKATVKLPKRAKGSWKLYVTYQGSTNYAKTGKQAKGKVKVKK